MLAGTRHGAPAWRNVTSTRAPLLANGSVGPAVALRVRPEHQVVPMGWAVAGGAVGGGAGGTVVGTTGGLGLAVVGATVAATVAEVAVVVETRVEGVVDGSTVVAMNVVVEDATGGVARRAEWPQDEASTTRTTSASSHRRLPPLRIAINWRIGVAAAC